MSIKDTLVALLFPLFVTAIEYVMVSPSLGVDISTDFTVTKSDEEITMISSESSAVALVSNWSWVLLMVFVKLWPAVPTSTFAVNNKVDVTPEFKEFIVQLGLFQIPFEGVPEMYVRPAGSMSCTIKFVAVITLLLVTWIL